MTGAGPAACQFCGAVLMFRGQTSCQSCGRTLGGLAVGEKSADAPAPTPPTVTAAPGPGATGTPSAAPGPGLNATAGWTSGPGLTTTQKPAAGGPEPFKWPEPRPDGPQAQPSQPSSGVGTLRQMSTPLPAVTPLPATTSLRTSSLGSQQGVSSPPAPPPAAAAAGSVQPGAPAGPPPAEYHPQSLFPQPGPTVTHGPTTREKAPPLGADRTRHSGSQKARQQTSTERATRPASPVQTARPAQPAQPPRAGVRGDQTIGGQGGPTWSSGGWTNSGGSPRRQYPTPYKVPNRRPRDGRSDGWGSSNDISVAIGVVLLIVGAIALIAINSGR
jgi:hypothetical protein